jgi:hypothetical protein
MKLTAFQTHKSWLIRAVLVLMVTGLAELGVVWLVPRPILWVTLIAGSLPLTMFFFVAFPVLREESQESS